MKKFNELLGKHNLTPEAKRKCSIFSATALAQAYINILTKEGLGMTAVGLVKEKDDVTFYIDITKIEKQFSEIFGKESIEDFIEKYKKRFDEVKGPLLDGNYELYPLYFSAMGAVKALTRYVGDSGRFKEHHQRIGNVFNEIAELYSVIEDKLTLSQKKLVFSLNYEILEKENFSLIYDGKWHEFEEVPKVSIESNEIKGNSIGKGTVSGEVSLTPKEGCIYVTTMTAPIDTPVLSKVKAIVTDEGGMLCHAAVIAREFNVSCIIGTKNATRILEEGDSVEVNLDKGTVKKLR